MTELTDIQAAAALSEQVYRRDDADQQIDLASIGAQDKSDDVGEITGFDRIEGYYYNNSTGFVGQIVEANGKIFVVFRGTDMSGGLETLLYPFIFGQTSTQEPVQPGQVDGLDIANDRGLIEGTDDRTQLEDALALLNKAKEIAGTGQEIVVTGQSLGGGLAALASMVNNIVDPFHRVQNISIAPAPFANEIPVYASYIAMAQYWSVDLNEAISRIRLWTDFGGVDPGSAVSLLDGLRGGSSNFTLIAAQNLELDPAELAQLVLNRENFLSALLSEGATQNQFYRIAGEFAEIGPAEYGLPGATTHYDIGEGSAVSKHGPSFHNLVIRAETTDQKFTSLLNSDAFLRYALLDDGNIFSPMGSDRADPGGPSKVIAAGPNPSAAYNLLWKTVGETGGAYDYFHRVFSDIMQKGAAGEGLEDTLTVFSGTSSLHNGLVTLALGVFRDAVQDSSTVQGFKLNLARNLGLESGEFTVNFAGGDLSGTPYSDRVVIDTKAITQWDAESPDGTIPYKESTDRPLGTSDIDKAVAAEAVSSFKDEDYQTALNYLSDLWNVNLNALGPASELSIGNWQVLVAQAGSENGALSHDATTDVDGRYASESHVIIGGNGNDTISGSLVDDFLLGGGGNDTFHSHGGKDLIIGGAGEDTYIADDQDIQGTSSPYPPEDAIEGDSIIFIGGVSAQSSDSEVDTADYRRNFSDTPFVVQLGMLDGTAVVGASVEFRGQTDGVEDTRVDTLIEVEKVLLGDKADKAIILDIDSDLPRIDFGDNPGQNDGRQWVDKADTVNASVLTEGVEADFRNSEDQTVSLLSNTESVLHFANAEGFIGTSFVDKIFGTDKIKFLDTGGGNDIVDGTAELAQINLGSGDDEIRSYGRGSVIATGEGVDTITTGSLGLINDLEAGDKLLNWAGEQIFGALWFGNSENAWAKDVNGMAYGYNGDELIIASAGFDADRRPETGLFISNFEIGMGGLTLGTLYIDAVSFWNWNPDPMFAAGNAGWSKAMYQFNTANYGPQSAPAPDPLALDLDGDGLELVALSGVTGMDYDFDQDGFIEPSGWIGRDDGYLSRDINGNGLIDGATELFGTPTRSGFDVLGDFDLNADSVIDAADAIWSDLSVWRDANGNGVTDAGELLTLAQLGIVSISLADTAPTGADATNAGHLITGTASYTMTGGIEREISNVVYRIDDYNTTWEGGTTHQLALDGIRPEIKGTGTLADLRFTMDRDPALAAAVEDLMPQLTSPNMDKLRAQIYPVLHQWAQSAVGTQPVNQHHDVIAIVETDSNFNQKVIDQIYLDTDGKYKFVSGRDKYVFHYNEDDSDPANDYTFEINLGASGSTTLPSLTPPPGMLHGQVDDNNAYWLIVEAETLAFAERQLGQRVSLDLARDNPLYSEANTALTNILRAVDLNVARLAFQGPLSPFFEGLVFDPVKNDFTATTARGLAPLFENIFESATTAPGGELLHIQDWSSLLFTLMNDVHRSKANLTVNTAFIFTNIVTAFENVAMASDIRDIAEVLGIPRDNIVSGGAGILERDESGLNGHASILYLNGGDQTARGGQGSDVYVVGRNFGYDVIDDYEEYMSDQKPDFLRFAHYDPADIVATRDGLDLVLTVAGTSNALRILGQFDGSGVINFDGSRSGHERGIFEIVFADGTVWDADDIARAVNRNTAGDDHITGTDVVDYLDGGAGNDLLEGGIDRDTYYFARGYGQDMINDAPSDSGVRGMDYLRLGPDIDSSDLHFIRNGSSNDLTIEIIGTSDTITINNQFDAFDSQLLGVFWRYRVEAILLDDGSGMSADTIMSELLSQAGTQGADTIYGFFRDDRLNGGAGNDYLNGGNLNDTYVFGLGYGDDTVFDDTDTFTSGDRDAIEFLSSIGTDDVVLSRGTDTDDLVIAIAGTSDTLTLKDVFKYEQFWIDRYEIEEFRFGDGTVWTAASVRTKLLDTESTTGNDAITGFQYDDTLEGGLGDDYLTGLEGNDTYVFNAGDGHDTIYDDGPTFGSSDKILINEYTVFDLRVSRPAGSNDILLTFVGTTDSILLNDNAISYIGTNIEYVTFEDGTVLTMADVKQLLVAQAATAGNDTIEGTDAAETIAGGLGDDYLIGHEGHDTYVFNAGDGDDTIYDDGPEFGSADRILINGYTFADIRVSRPSAGSNDLLITFAGSTDSILVKNNMQSYIGTDIETVAFGDGSVYTMSQIKQLLVDQGGTDGDDTIEGTNAAEVITGGRGNDTLIGHEGKDTYVFHRGDGNDVVNDDGPEFGSSDTVLLRGYTLADLHVIKPSINSANIVLAFFSTADTIVLTNNANSYIGSNIEWVKFEDGTTLGMTALRQLLVDQAATSGDDIIAGTFADETLTGGLGNDTLYGDKGSDTYVFNPGDGDDVVNDNGPSSGSLDRVLLNGRTAAELHVSRSGSDNILLTFAGSTDSVLLTNNLNNYIGTDIERVILGDGTTFTPDSLRQELLYDAMTSGNDSITGFSTNDIIYGGDGNDTLNGASGADTLYGGAGNDSYVVDNAGDIVIENANEGIDLITSSVSRTLGANIENLTLSGNSGISGTGNDLDNVITGNGGANALSGGLGNDRLNGGAGNDAMTGGQGNDVYVVQAAGDVVTETAGQGIDTIESSVTITALAAEVENLSLTGTSAINGTGNSLNNILLGNSAANTLSGAGGDDTITGGAGNDALSGGAGADRFVFASGFGKDTISDFSAGMAGLDVISLSLGTPFDTFAEVMAVATQSGANTVITFNSSTTITLTGVTLSSLVADDFLFV